MADPKGFLTTGREVAKTRPVGERVKDWNEVYVPRLPAADHQQAGRPLHGLRHPVLPQRLSAREPDPRVERLRLPRGLGGGERAAARDEQLPGVHRAGCAPLRASRRACSASTSRPSPSRTSKSRSSTRRGTRGDVSPAAAGAPVRQDGRGHRLGPGRSGRRPAADPGRPHGRRLRARGPHRRPAAVRHPRVQDGEACTSTAVSSRCARRAPSSVPASRSAATSTATTLRQAVRRGGHRRRAPPSARPAGPGP